MSIKNSKNAALVSTSGPNPGLSFQELSKPSPGPGQVLVEISHVAQNPTDVQSLDSAAFGEGAVLGCDFVGKVVDTGEGVSLLTKGDLIAALIWGGEIKGLGAYSHYTIADEKIAFKLPSTIDAAAAATMPLALNTAWLAMFSKGCLNMTREKNQSILVWGGSSSVGQYTIQIAALYGMNVVTTCSPKNFSLVKKLGAAHVFDYNAPDVVESIRKAAPDLKYAFDTIGSKGSSTKVSQALNSDAKPVMCTVRPGKANTEDVANEVRITDVLVWTAFLKDHAYGDFKWPADPEDHELSAELYRNIPSWIQDGRIKPNDVILVKGLKSVSEGFQKYRDGNISAQKIVYEI